MYEKGVPVKIGGKQYKLVFTLAALLNITERYGGVEEMADKLTGPADVEGDTPEILARKAKERQKANVEALRELPHLIALLANQGTMLETGITSPNNPDLLTPEKVALYVTPKDTMGLLNAVTEAINIGMGVEHTEGDDAEVDVVLQELQRKNGEGAAV